MEVIFYSKEGDQHILEISSPFYRWLAISEFSKIKNSEPFTISIDGEEVSIEAVELNEFNRSSYIYFFQNCILQESYELITKLDSSSNPGLLKASSPEGSLENLKYRIKKFYEFLESLKNPTWIYMEYV